MLAELATATTLSVNHKTIRVQRKRTSGCAKHIIRFCIFKGRNRKKFEKEKS